MHPGLCPRLMHPAYAPGFVHPAVTPGATAECPPREPENPARATCKREQEREFSSWPASLSSSESARIQSGIASAKKQCELEHRTF
jgi:hypothetical protein